MKKWVGFVGALALSSMAFGAEPLAVDQAVVLVRDLTSVGLLVGGARGTDAQILLRYQGKDVARLPIHVNFLNLGLKAGFAESNGTAVFKLDHIDGKTPAELLGRYYGKQAAAALSLSFADFGTMVDGGGGQYVSVRSSSGVSLKADYGASGLDVDFSLTTANLTRDQRYDSIEQEAWNRPIHWEAGAKEHFVSEPPKTEYVFCKGANNRSIDVSIGGDWKLPETNFWPLFSTRNVRSIVREVSDRKFVITQADANAKEKDILRIELDATEFKPVKDPYNGESLIGFKSAIVVRSRYGAGECRIGKNTQAQAEALIQALKDAAAVI